MLFLLVEEEIILSCPHLTYISLFPHLPDCTDRYGRCTKLSSRGAASVHTTMLFKYTELQGSHNLQGRLQTYRTPIFLQPVQIYFTFHRSRQSNWKSRNIKYLKYHKSACLLASLLEVRYVCRQRVAYYALPHPLAGLVISVARWNSPHRETWTCLTEKEWNTLVKQCWRQDAKAQWSCT